MFYNRCNIKTSVIWQSVGKLGKPMALFDDCFIDAELYKKNVSV